ncbi:MAG: hypothetical protein KC731_30695 [Myxococcales bacterium]|nr:hypothetical protein [Myxococcales bacterium]
MGSFSVTTILAAALLGGCSSAGVAVGHLEEPTGESRPPTETSGEMVTLTWKSAAGVPTRGEIEGILPDGVHFIGPYHEVVKTARSEDYDDLWEGWTPYWPEWARDPRRAGEPEIETWNGFVTLFTGRVVANLRSDDGTTRMRCHFSIDEPEEGLRGGGHGHCQLSNGERIDALAIGPL